MITFLELINLHYLTINYLNDGHFDGQLSTLTVSMKLFVCATCGCSSFPHTLLKPYYFFVTIP